MLEIKIDIVKFCQVALALWKGRYGVLGVVENFGKELRDHELVHWGLFWHILSVSKMLLEYLP